MLLIDQSEALRTLPDLLPPDHEARDAAFALVEQVSTARGALSGEAAGRLEEIRAQFEAAPPLGANPPGNLHIAARRRA